MESGGNSKTLRRRLQRQLEFYLSESNLRQDKFLQQSMDAQGFVAIDAFVSFNKCVACCRLLRLSRLALTNVWMQTQGDGRDSEDGARRGGQVGAPARERGPQCDRAARATVRQGRHEHRCGC